MNKNTFKLIKYVINIKNLKKFIDAYSYFKIFQTSVRISGWVFKLVTYLFTGSFFAAFLMFLILQVALVKLSKQFTKLKINFIVILVNYTRKYLMYTLVEYLIIVK